MLRPGADIVDLPRWAAIVSMHWSRPILTDLGRLSGFQPEEACAKIHRGGRAISPRPIDGSDVRLTPRGLDGCAVEVCASDIAMAAGRLHAVPPPQRVRLASRWSAPCAGAARASHAHYYRERPPRGQRCAPPIPPAGEFWRPSSRGVFRGHRRRGDFWRRRCGSFFWGAAAERDSRTRDRGKRRPGPMRTLSRTPDSPPGGLFGHRPQGRHATPPCVWPSLESLMQLDFPPASRSGGWLSAEAPKEETSAGVPRVRRPRTCPRDRPRLPHGALVAREDIVAAVLRGIDMFRLRDADPARRGTAICSRQRVSSNIRKTASTRPNLRAQSTPPCDCYTPCPETTPGRTSATSTVATRFSGLV